MLFINHKIVFLKKLFLIVFVGMIFNLHYLYAQQGYRRHFLSYGPSTAAAALGDTYTALGDEATVIYYNPALFTTMKGYSTSVSNWFLYEDARYSYAGFSASNKKHAFSVGGIQFSRDNIEKRKTITDEPVDITNQQTAMYAAYAKYLKSLQLHTGLTFKYLDYKMDTENEQGYSIDIGFARDIYSGKSKVGKYFKIKSGLTIQNIYQEPITMIEEAEEMPFGAILGLGLIWSVFPRYLEKTDSFLCDKIKFSTDLGYIDNVFEYSAGLEYIYKKFAHIRAGWKNGLTCGMGFIFKNIKLDYTLMMKDFASFNRVGISYTFGTNNKKSKKRKRQIGKHKNIDLLNGEFRLKEEVQIALKEEEKRENRFKPLFNKAKKDYNKKRYLRATDGFVQIMLEFPEKEKIKSYYYKIEEEMKSILENQDVTDLKKYAYARGYMEYVNQNINNAVNEWDKYLQIEPDNEEVKEYLEKARKYLVDIENNEKEKKLGQEIKNTFNQGVENYNKKQWIKSVKIMEKVIEMCKQSKFPGVYKWNVNAKKYIDKALKNLMKKKIDQAKKAAKSQEQEEKQEKPQVDKQGSDKKYKEALVSYAHGKTSEAITLWGIALRLDPGNEKAKKALNKAKEELEVK